MCPNRIDPYKSILINQNTDVRRFFEEVKKVRSYSVQGLPGASTGAFAIRLSLGHVHFVDFSMERAAAYAELFGSGGYVAIRRCEGLSN